MRYILTFAFLLAFSIALIGGVSAEPEVLMVSVDPGNVDNQVDEAVNFEGDCTVCNADELQHFVWRSSVDNVLKEGDNFADINFMKSSTEFSEGNHEITLQVQDNNGNWSEINDNSTAYLGVTEGHGGGGGSIEVNFDVTPPSLHIGETARFAACSEMEPEPQPCVSEPDPDLSFDWTIQWEGDEEWAYLGSTESFNHNSFEEGTHNVRLIITNNDDGEVSDPGYQEIIVLPPIPVAVIDMDEPITVKEGQPLEISSHCENNNAEEIDCEHSWEIWEYKDSGDFLFSLSSRNITLNCDYESGDGSKCPSSEESISWKTDRLTNEDPSEYELMLRTTDGQGTLSAWVSVIVTVNPPNELPSAGITISPQSLGGLTPEYYQYTNLTFSSSSSNDPDGWIVSQKWWFNNEIVSEEVNWVSSFSETTIYQIKLEVQDNDGVWSTNVSTNFKIVENTPPSVDFVVFSEGLLYTFNSTVSDVEGSVVVFEWFMDGVLISTEANTTYLFNQSGSYEITFRAADDGGLWSEDVSQVIEVTVTIAEQKNFVATFSSKNIDVGDDLNIDFSGTKGAVDHYEIVVNNPDGTKDTYETTEDQFTIDFPVGGIYTLDVTVFWADGIPQDGLADWYGPTVYVGEDAETGSTDNTPIPEDALDDNPLPSVSLLVTLVVMSLLAASRRQR